MAGEQAPLVRVLTGQAAALAAGAEGHGTVEAPYDGTVTEVTYTPVGAIAGAAVNSRTLRLVNRGQDGTGVAVVASLALLAGVNAAAFDETALGLSATAADLEVTAGDVLDFQSVAVGTGIADPGGTFAVTIARG